MDKEMSENFKAKLLERRKELNGPQGKAVALSALKKAGYLSTDGTISKKYIDEPGSYRESDEIERLLSILRAKMDFFLSTQALPAAPNVISGISFDRYSPFTLPYFEEHRLHWPVTPGAISGFVGIYPVGPVIDRHLLLHFESANYLWRSLQDSVKKDISNLESH